VVTDAKGSRAVTAGFAGDIKVWACQDGHWSADETSSGIVITSR
jgi:superkiller protein 8